MPKYLLGLYCTNSKTPYTISLLISYCQDFLNSSLRVVITPSFRSSKNSSVLTCSFLVIKVINMLSLFLIATTNCLLKSVTKQQLLQRISCSSCRVFFDSLGCPCLHFCSIGSCCLESCCSQSQLLLLLSLSYSRSCLV